MESQFPWTEIIMQAGYAGLLLYLTFRIFRLLDAMVSLIREIRIIVTVSSTAAINSASEDVKGCNSVAKQQNDTA